MAKKLNYASLYTLRPDGRYQGYYRDQDGKRHVVCDRDPEKLYRKIEDLENPPPLTFRQIAEAWHDWKWPKIREGTRVCYRPAYQRAVELFGTRTASEIEPYEIQNHLVRLKENDYSAKTIKTQRVVYRSIFRHAIVDPVMGKEVRVNPVTDIPLPNGMKKAVKREAPNDTVVEKIRNGTGAYFGLFPLLLMSTGLRRGEALAIQWQDIDFKEKRIRCSKQISYEGGMPTVADTKTDAGVREVPILPDLLFYLKAAKPKDAKPEHYVFYGTNPEKYMPESTYKRRWLHYCKEMGFVTDSPEKRQGARRNYVVHHYKPTLTAHVLRHGYATLLFEAGVDAYSAQALLGHADIETTTAIYTHLRNKQKEASLKKLEDHVAAQLAVKNG